MLDRVLDKLRERGSATGEGSRDATKPLMDFSQWGCRGKVRQRRELVKREPVEVSTLG